MGSKTAPEGVEEENGMKEDWVSQKTFSATWQLGAQDRSSKGGAGAGPLSLSNVLTWQIVVSEGRQVWTGGD